MKLMIMTRGREGRQHTWNNLPPSLQAKTTIFAPPTERHPNMLPEPHPMDCSEKIQWMIDNHEGKFVMLDDDLRFCAPSGDGKLMNATPEQIEAGFAMIEQLLDEHPLVGLHPRAHGNTCKSPIEYNGRITHLYGMNLDTIKPIKVDYFPILADMYLNLTLLTKGHSTAVICTLLFDWVGGSNAPGGCSIHRTWEQQKEAVLGLKESFPEFVTVKQKVTKNGWWGDKPRFDFIIQWKKAYEYGKNRTV